MISINKVEVLADALKKAARNHHFVSLHSQIPGMHYGQHWQHCPASSCSQAFNALFTTGIFKPEHLETRQRVQEKMYAGLDNRVRKLNDS